MRNRTLVGFTTLSLLLAACGPDRLTHEELVTKGDQICSDALAGVRQAVATPAPTTPEAAKQLADELSQATAALNQVADGLGALDPPQEERDAYSKVVAAWQDAATAASSAQRSAAAGLVQALTQDLGEAATSAR